jgi:hypothetical protein
VARRAAGAARVALCARSVGREWGGRGASAQALGNVEQADDLPSVGRVVEMLGWTWSWRW